MNALTALAHLLLALSTHHAAGDALPGSERLLAQVDAQGHVVALVDHANGSVVERYLYDPDGRLTVVDAAGVLQPPGTESAYHWRVLWNQAWHDGGGRYLQRSGMLWDATLGSTLTYNPVLALVDKLPAPELGLWDTVVYAWQQAADVFWEDPALAGHLALDAIGLIPVIGRSVLWDTSISLCLPTPLKMLVGAY